MKVIVVTGKSESGDNYGPWVFDKKPSGRQLHLFLKENVSSEFPGEGSEDGPGVYGSYLHIDIYEVEVMEKNSLSTHE